MILGIRSGILCGELKRHPDGVIDYLDIKSDTIASLTRPGGENLWLAITLDVDGLGGPLTLKLDAPHFEHRLSVTAPPGPLSTSLNFPIALPITEEGVLSVTVIDEARRTEPFTIKWRLDFYDNAPDPGFTAAELNDKANDYTGKVIASLQPPRPGKAH